MAETITTLVTAAKKSKFSMISHLTVDGKLKALMQIIGTSFADVLIVWDELADFIEKQMLLTKVHTPCITLPHSLLLLGCLCSWIWYIYFLSEKD